MSRRSAVRLNHLGAGFERRADPNPNANTANVVTISFFPMIDIPSVVSPIEPTITAKFRIGDQECRSHRQHLQISQATPLPLQVIPGNHDPFNRLALNESIHNLRDVGDRDAPVKIVIGFD